MSKYRSKVDYLQIHSGDKQGYNLGLDGSIFLKKEVTPRVFNAPSIGTQGVSTSAASPSLDISAGSDTNLRVAVDGGPVTAVTLVVAGLTTGLLIAAALESKINTALAAAGLDTRVWADFSGGLYHVHSQSTGLVSAVVITPGATNDVTVDLKLGLANSGVETVGVDDTDFLLYTTGGPTFSQPVESNQHRSGRYHSGIIKKKKVAEYTFETYVNMNGLAGASIDPALQLLIESALGKKTVVASTSIDFTQDLPVVYFSIVQVSTIFGQYFTGAYAKGVTLTFPGDGPSMMKHAGKASDSAIAGLALVSGAVVASATVVLEAGASKRYSEGAHVMLVDVDGRTITGGADGSLTVVSEDDIAGNIVLSTTVSVADQSFIVPWHPGAVQQTGRDAIYTDLVGSFKLSQGGSNIDITSCELDIQNDHNDLDGYFGHDANAGFIAGNRMTGKLTVTFNLSNENFGEVVRTRKFGGYNPQIILGAIGSGRYLKITAPKWIPAVPNIEVPQNGPTPITLEGTLYQSAPGARDPIKVSFL